MEGSTSGITGTMHSRTDCSFIAMFEPTGPVSDIEVVGDFNGWVKGSDYMHDNNNDGVYWAELKAPKGWHQYRILVDGETFQDPFNPLTLFDEAGRENSAFYIPDCSRPKLSPYSLDVSRDGSVTARVLFEQGAKGTGPDRAGTFAILDNDFELEPDVDNNGTISIETSDLPPGKHIIRINAVDEAGKKADPLALRFWVEDRKFDWRDAIIYQVMIDRFRKADGALDSSSSISFFHGGDLDGVRQALEDGYFTSLGVNVIWLSPVYENPEGTFTGRDGYPSQAYHGYWPSQPRSVEERFGGDEALARLVRAAHERGIRIMADLVLNHVEKEHPYFRNYGGAGWFNHPDGDCICGSTCPWSTSIETCWFDPFLPDLNWKNTHVVEQLISDAEYWAGHFDLDGFRLDAVPMMPRLATRHLAKAMEKGPGVSGLKFFLLGETYTMKQGQMQIQYYLGPHGLSGQFDFPVMWALRDALAGRSTMADLDDEIKAGEDAWKGSGAVMGMILGNHDVARFISDINNDNIHDPRNNPPARPQTKKPYELMKMAWTFLFTMPGMPVIYYGDEFGMPGATDPDNRRNMRFQNDLSQNEKALLDYVRKLAKARTCSDALRRGERTTLEARPLIYVYARDCGNGYPAVVAFNSAIEQRTIKINLPENIKVAAGAEFKDILSGKAWGRAGELEIDIGPRSSVLLLSGPKCNSR
ncbi:MAG: hypothetical protein GXP49_17365 [Deltaproteobacteria bacterium]|nr:hypothetical protein [Deltaproteobacteria bacterium]